MAANYHLKAYSRNYVYFFSFLVKILVAIKVIFLLCRPSSFVLKKKKTF